MIDSTVENTQITPIKGEAPKTNVPLSEIVDPGAVDPNLTKGVTVTGVEPGSHTVLTTVMQKEGDPERKVTGKIVATEEEVAEYQKRSSEENEASSSK